MPVVPGGVILGGRNVVGGALWGTNPYTADSSLGLAAVHAGILKLGQTGVVRVTMIQSPAMFDGSTKNGVTSTPYPQPYPGAYKLMPGKR